MIVPSATAGSPRTTRIGRRPGCARLSARDGVDEPHVDRLLPDPWPVEAAAQSEVDLAGGGVEARHVPIQPGLVPGVSPPKPDDGEHAVDSGICDELVEELVLEAIAVEVADDDDAV